MKCAHCGGSLVRRQGHHDVIGPGYRLTLTDIPIWICSRCGRSVLSDWQNQILERLQDRMAAALMDLRRQRRV